MEAVMSNQIAAQEDSARETQAQRDKDVVYARDFAAIVEALRGYRPTYRASNEFQWSVTVLLMSAQSSTANDYSFFASQWGTPALLRALAKAIELETE